MSALLSGVGGASCQMCIATRAEVKYRDLIIQGFPTSNQKITDMEN